MTTRRKQRPKRGAASSAKTKPRTLADLPRLEQGRRRAYADVFRSGVIAVLTPHAIERTADGSWSVRGLQPANAERRLFFDPEVLKTALFAWEGGDPHDGQAWIISLMHASSASIFETIARLVETPDLTALGTNALSAIGNMVSFGVKRQLLHRLLTTNNWSLLKTAADSGLKTTAAVLRAINDLQLHEELAAARTAGLVTRAWNKKTPPPSEK